MRTQADVLTSYMMRERRVVSKDHLCNDDFARKIRSTRYISFGPFEVDQYVQSVRENGRLILLLAKEYQLLMILLQNLGKIVTWKELRMKVLPMDPIDTFDDKIRDLANRLRAAMGEHYQGDLYIKGFRKWGRKGYALILKEKPHLHETSFTYMPAEEPFCQVVPPAIQFSLRGSESQSSSSDPVVWKSRSTSNSGVSDKNITLVITSSNN